MMRTVFALIAGLLCAFLGMRQARRLQSENTRLHRWETILQHLCLLLQESALSLPEALRQCACEASPADALLQRLAESMQHDPLTPLNELYQPEGTEGPVLSRLMTRLSRGSLESRVQAVQQAAQEINLLAENAREKSSQDARMWRTLGWTLGACLTLMLL